MMDWLTPDVAIGINCVLVIIFGVVMFVGWLRKM